MCKKEKNKKYIWSENLKDQENIILDNILKTGSGAPWEVIRFWTLSNKALIEGYKNTIDMSKLKEKEIQEWIRLVDVCFPNNCLYKEFLPECHVQFNLRKKHNG